MDITKSVKQFTIEYEISLLKMFKILRALWDTRTNRIIELLYGGTEVANIVAKRGT